MAEELPEPKNRKEEYLANIAGMDVELPEPANREEIYLNAIAENGGGGGGGTSDFNQLSNRPKYNGQEMTSSTDIPVPDNVKIIDETCLNWNSAGLPVEPYNEVAVFLLEPGVYEVTPDFQYNVIPDPSGTVEEHRHYRFIVPEPTEFENGDYGDYKQISVYAFCLDGNYSYGNTNGITEYVSNYNKDVEGEWYNGDTKEYTTSSYVNDFISTYVMPLFPQISSTVPDADTQGQLGGLLIILDENASADQRTARLFICDGDEYDNVQQKFVYYWTEIGAGGGGPTVVQTTGTSTTDVMSQDAATKMVFKNNNNHMIQIGNADVGYNAGVAIGSQGMRATGDYSVGIGRGDSHSGATGYASTAVGGLYPSASGERATALGSGATASGIRSIALGTSSTASLQGEMNIGNGTATNLYNGSGYRLLSGVYDGQTAHDAVNLGQLNGRVMTGAGAPTTATVGTVGQLLEDTTNGKLYQCTAVDTTDPQNPSYTWTEVGAGGGGPTVVQTTGTSTTDVMSQNAASNMVYKNGDATKIKIGSGAQNTLTSNNTAIAIGTAAVSADYAVAIGGAMTAEASATSAVALQGVASGHSAVAIGIQSSATARGAVAIGRGAKATNVGQFDIGTRSTSDGYNSSLYRLLSGVHDGQDLHDAATVAQGNTLATTAPTTSTVGVLGQLYTDTTNMHTYQCTAISGDTYTWTQRW